MKAKNYLSSKVETMQFVLPEHLNHMGNMHGGEIMKLMDNTAGLAFTRHAEGNAVTAGVKEINFIRPIPEKSIIKCVAEVVKTGKSSMETHVEVLIENIQAGEAYKVAEGIFTGVAIDDNGKPRPVAPIRKENKIL